MGAGEESFELAIIGAGYVGLVMAASLSMLGFAVRCIDRNARRIDDLERGVMPFFEPGLEDSVIGCIEAGQLRFGRSVSDARGAAAMFVAVGTLDEAGEWSSRDVDRTVADIAADRSLPRTLIVRSTLMPGSMARLSDLVRGLDPDVEICLNPEFTRQGSALAEFARPDRVVVGLTRPRSASRALPILERVYAAVEAPLLVTDAASAELIKVGSNVFLALKAGYANELARIAAATGADVSDVANGIGMDRRIGREYLSPGPGFGGSCLPSQSRALPGVAVAEGLTTPIIAAISASNAAQAEWVVQQLTREIGALSGRRIALLGLTFKAGTDDVRESPALRVARELTRHGARVVAHDPTAGDGIRSTIARDGLAIEVAATAEQAICEADATVVTTDWPEYRDLDWAALGDSMHGHTVIDTRGAVDEASASAAGVQVVLHGRASSEKP
jgi:UDPglucose 6-dehydrogenase